MYTKYENFSFPELLYEAERTGNMLALEIEKRMIEPEVYEDSLEGAKGVVTDMMTDLQDAVEEAVRRLDALSKEAT